MGQTYLDALAHRSFPLRADPAFAEFPGVAAAATVEDLVLIFSGNAELQAKAARLTRFTPSHWLVGMELDEVDRRREAHGLPHVAAKRSETENPLERALASNLVGLCCSGGGIRSATFNLGILQGLAKLDLLKQFDYLSSVSGGGYIHQWLAAWIQRSSFAAVNDGLKPPPSGPADAAPEIRWLQSYSNYLTPKAGFFTADTWVGFVTWLRNALLVQLSLATGLFLVLLLPQFLAIEPDAIRAAPQQLLTVPGTGVWAIGAVVMVFILLVSVVVVARSLSGLSESSGTDDTRDYSEADIQRLIVLPMLFWAVLLTMAERFIADAALPVFGAIAVFGAVAAAVLAFGGGALTAYVERHHGGWEGWSAARKESRRAYFPVARASAGIVIAAAMSGAIAAAWTAFVPPYVARLLFSQFANANDQWRVMLVLGPPVFLLAPMAGLGVLIGLLGRTFHNGRREWLSRLGAWAGMYAAMWIGVCGASLCGRLILDWALKNGVSAITALGGWAGLTVGGVLAGNSANTGGRPAGANGKAPSKWNYLAVAAPYVFVTGLLLILGAAGQAAIMWAQRVGWWGFAAIVLVPACVSLLFGWRVDVNEFSLHAYYRDRLARCYLGASNRKRHPNMFTGFDGNDARLAVADLKPSRGYEGPLPVFCTALNLIVGEQLAWQERKAASFAFGSVVSGYDVPWASQSSRKLRYSGYADTATYAYPSGPSVATAAAISGAAVSPNMGYHTNPATGFLLTLFNVRLGWWLRNPRTVRQDGEAIGDGGRVSPSPQFALLQLQRELFGQINDTSSYVYLTDGGHFENMGLYELVRRGCRYIVICDAEQDGDLKFDGIASAIRKCRIDFGVDVSIDLRMLQRVVAGVPYLHRHAVVGTITYPGHGPDCEGKVVYIKSSLTGDEAADVLSHQLEDDAFPDDSTADQWFNESQFESYRKLGYHIALGVFEPASGAMAPGTPFAVDDYFGTLSDIWYPPTPAMEKFQAAHTARYDVLVHELRTEPRLAGLLELLIPPTVPSRVWLTPSRTADQRAFGMGFGSELFEFIWAVYDDLGLVHASNRLHPRTQGWMKLFKRWFEVDVVREAWLNYAQSYANRFQSFVETNLL